MGKKSKKSKKNKFNINFLVDILHNKYELATLTAVIYLSGVTFQALKLIGGFTTAPKLGNLMFFSFSNSINDFCIIFGVSFFFFFFSFATVALINLCLQAFNINQNKKINALLLLTSFVLLLYVLDKTGLELWNIKKTLLLLAPYVLSIALIGYLIIKKCLEKSAFYFFLATFLIYGFILLLYHSNSYYGCNQLHCNEQKKNCILLKYKNDKFGFTGDGDIYRLDEFKSFYTIDYFKDNIKTGTEYCEDK